ncbi:MAG: pyridoxal phosphate-dependent decarboxylase family protein [Bacteroidota bacterium]
MATERELLQRLTDMMATYLEENFDPETKVVDYVPAKEVHELMDFKIQSEGQDYEQFFKHIETYLKHAVRTRHPQFWNQLWSGYTFPSLLAQFVTALTNTSMFTYEMAPLATMMELEIINKLGNYIGWENAEGQLATGGSNANMIAMLAARDWKLAHTREQGLTAVNKALRVYVSDQAHYSFSRGMQLLGLGTNNLVEIQSEPNGKMIPEALHDAIRADKAAGHLPFFVSATAGTTVLGAFDPIETIADIAEQAGLWLYMDAAWGGAAMLSPKHTHLVKGSHRARSATWNPHKTMGMHLPCSVILFRDVGTMGSSCGSGSTEYIFHEYENEAYDMGPQSLQCGRQVDALKLWLTWKLYGSDQYAKRTEHCFAQTQHAVEFINKHPRLHLMRDPEYLNVVLQYVPESAKPGPHLNQLNEAARNSLVQSGDSMVNFSFLKDGNFIFRPVFASAEKTFEDVELMLNNIVKHGDKMAKAMATTTARRATAQ